jgi:hypothetical protein
MKILYKKLRKIYVEIYVEKGNLLRSSDDEFNIQKETFQIDGK